MGLLYLYFYVSTCKVVPVYATKTCGGDGGIALLIPNLDARWTLTALYSEVRDRVTKLIGEWEGSRDGGGDLE